MSQSNHSLRRQSLRLLALLTGLAVLATATTASAQWLQHLRQLDNSNTKVTALVVNLDNMETIAALNPDLALTPASASKLFATAAALEQFGPDHRFTTRFVSAGNIRDGVLLGDLVFVGSGDPMLDTRDVRALVQHLKAAGIRKINGNLVIDNGLFGAFKCFIKDRCEARTRASEAYSAPLSSAGTNFGTVQINVYPGAVPGADTRIVLTPLGLPGYVIDNNVTTGSAGTRPRLAVWREYANGRNIIHVRGELPAGGRHYSIYRAVADAATQTRRVVATILADAGIQVSGTATVRPVASAGLKTIASISSDRLGELIIPMMAYSNNYMADMLTLAVAADQGFGTPLRLSRASQTLEQLAIRSLNESYPKRARKVSRPKLTSGSGLSVSNKLSARHLVALLNHMYHQPALFPSFYGSIPVPVSSATNTLKHGNQDWSTRIVAKTGTLTEPVTVRALAGYFRMQDGGFAAFAVIINGTQKRPAIGFRDTVLNYQHDFEEILAAY